MSREVAGKVRGGRRAEVGREIERHELSSGYAVMIGRKSIDDSGELVGEYLKADGSGTAYAPYDSVITDYADACERLAAVVRDSASGADANDFPPPEYPRLVFVRLSASVVGVV